LLQCPLLQRRLLQVLCLYLRSVCLWRLHLDSFPVQRCRVLMCRLLQVLFLYLSLQEPNLGLRSVCLWRLQLDSSPVRRCPMLLCRLHLLPKLQCLLTLFQWYRSFQFQHPLFLCLWHLHLRLLHLYPYQSYLFRLQCSLLVHRSVLGFRPRDKWRYVR